MRSLGLDVGTKTVGVAISDPMGWTAQGLTTVRRQNFVKDLAALKALADEHQAVRWVVGLPLNMDGSHGPQAEFVEDFMARLAKICPIPAVYIDERLSSKQAQRSMMDAGMRRDKRKAMIDEQAAMVILQIYLDRERYQAQQAARDATD
ncbi:MAG: Holliday junction resolvase RuvX [Candidatus Sericytochromatia bacterium]|nr:Holliday junction resolvase RuvX [Candidatus Sericytochromatia bacterium]